MSGHNSAVNNPAPKSNDRPTHVVGRRSVLAAAGAVAAMAALPSTASGAPAAPTSTTPSLTGPAADVLPFRGAHQTGIALPRQTDTVLASFDVTTKSLAGLRALLNRWTVVAEALTQGVDVPDLPIFGNSPADPGETWGFTPHNLTITVGVGPRIFTGTLGKTFGLTHKRPTALAPLPKFAGDNLQASISQGDFVLQVCADNSAVAAHALRQMARAAKGTAKLRWLQAGAAPATPDGGTGRNLFGFKDGTATIKPDELADQDKFVWTQPGDGPHWHTGGTFLVYRRIHMELQAWDSALIDIQEASIGRDKLKGAPLSGGVESTPVDLNKKSASGRRLVPFNSHVAQSHPSNNKGVRMLRRGYGYVNGVLPNAEYDAGLLFMAFVRNPVTHFIPMQRKLAASDNLTRWSTPIGSGVYAVFPGLPQGKTWANQLLD
jgi:deferrochelatase/peroxidase EfeB